MSYDEDDRRQLRQMLVGNGVKPDRAAQIVDLACHAADRAMAALTDVIRLAPDSGIGLMAFGIALQLGRSRMEAAFERTRKFGEAQGLPQYATPVRIRA